MPIDRRIFQQKVSLYSSAILTGTGGDESEIFKADTELYRVVELYHSNNILVSTFCDEGISAEQREQMAKEIFADFSDEVRTVLSVMASEGDFNLISHVAEAYTSLAEDALGSVIVNITTVVELDDHLRETIKSKLSEDFGKPIILREDIDRSIIGGIIMSAHGKRIDASVATQVDNAHGVLSNSPIGGER